MTMVLHTKSLTPEEIKYLTEVREAISKAFGAPSHPKKDCSSCGIELCKELDAYYGRDPVAERHCSKCRRKMRLE